MAAAKKEVDWKVVEREYRAGVKTMRKLADEHGISHAAVGKRAKRDGWTRTAVLATPEKSAVVLTPLDEMSSDGFLYVIYLDSGSERFYKIGMSKRFGSRLEQHQCASPFDICVAICYFTGNMRNEERALHQRFAAQNVRGEWFRLSDDDLAEIALRAKLV
jgi:hypothetical protein